MADFNIRIDHYFHLAEPGSELEIQEALANMEASMATMQEAVAALRAEVERNTSVDQSIIALVNGFADRLEAAAGDPTEIEALVAEMRGSNDLVAAAVVANTPAAPETPAVDPPEPPPVDENPPASDPNAINTDNNSNS